MLMLPGGFCWSVIIIIIIIIIIFIIIITIIIIIRSNTGILHYIKLRV